VETSAKTSLSVRRRFAVGLGASLQTHRAPSNIPWKLWQAIKDEIAVSATAVGIAAARTAGGTIRTGDGWDAGHGAVADVGEEGSRRDAVAAGRGASLRRICDFSTQWGFPAFLLSKFISKFYV
jgi:hypothetical protein